MSQLLELLARNKMTLIVALPENNLELAEAASKGGADALLLAGDLSADKKNMKAIVSRLKVPVGIDQNRAEHFKKTEVEAMAGLGFDFIDINFENFSGEIVKLKKIAKVLSLNSRFFLDDLVEIEGAGLNALDAAIVPQSGQGKELVVGDLQNYISIILSAGLPVIIPTQRSIRPSEVAIIADTGAKGILLTPVVTGTSAKHIEKNTREFRVAIDDLGE
ncbi:hypothetical protein A3H38_00635 [candidate division WOR-1 bacterium RIFCSPLOWO2_02_FULL_46_20]|uniref:Indole-3-glycerol-phosphate synthase n=2 Tax=Saganbacteria TaxID=1703751 RepID=A0A1F4RGU9_UNCSA|nr:MAG: hypothetical protein A3J44_03895 [candidate division WOR-1 bacterium RIFCSPHIGHO2_02_FULL_45_12]OGC07419.1 MAG: hypothetical protein A3H38_00635 [candidate division WOR-1 bacterium RIFCSPLOWO2_02_FULL_46_20]OGC07888.1 MAG: hypothetical protein A3F86_03090 [candidate division WOR-1 bacterium RIFCSPLOWO2_12_FULL_45_9]